MVGEDIRNRLKKIAKPISNTNYNQLVVRGMNNSEQ